MLHCMQGMINWLTMIISKWKQKEKMEGKYDELVQSLLN